LSVRQFPKVTPARGIYILDFYGPAGDELLVAITSCGRSVGMTPFKPHTYDEAYRLMELQLAHADPLPMLRAI
jgi:hypothetical protein